jgi:DNA gyrase subunit B
LVEQIGDSDITGTIVKWKADKLIFETTEYVFPTLVAKYRQAAYLNP